MTREEAIRILSRYTVYGCGVCLQDIYLPNYLNAVEALEMAIKALSVDLVRCGECKYRDCCFELNDKIEADDYCSCGERRSND